MVGVHEKLWLLGYSDNGSHMHLYCRVIDSYSMKSLWKWHLFVLNSCFLFLGVREIQWLCRVVKEVSNLSCASWDPWTIFGEVYLHISNQTFGKYGKSSQLPVLTSTILAAVSLEGERGKKEKVIALVFL